MQKRAGILFISKKSSRILLVLEDTKWTVPTFSVSTSVFEDSKSLITAYCGKETRLIPVELYLSQDQGFEYSTYICLVDQEFLTDATRTFCWADMGNLPKSVHSGLKATLTNKIIQSKIDTVIIIGNSQ
jgi:hypothetical protein